MTLNYKDVTPMEALEDFLERHEYPIKNMEAPSGTFYDPPFSNETIIEGFMLVMKALQSIPDLNYDS